MQLKTLAIKQMKEDSEIWRHYVDWCCRRAEKQLSSEPYVFDVCFPYDKYGINGAYKLYIPASAGTQSSIELTFR